MKQYRKKYDKAFKLEAIRLSIDEGRNISEVERNLDISKGTLAAFCDLGNSFTSVSFYR